MGYQASYTTPYYIFADFNGGRYASRNAALQQQVSWLTGIPLVPDGDLLTYDAHGQPREKDTESLNAIFSFRRKYALGLSTTQIRQDVQQEKSVQFEETATYRTIKHTYTQVFHQQAPYARIPEVKLESVKFTNPKDNLWFTRSVEQKYQRCSQRYQGVSEKLPQVVLQTSDMSRNVVAQPASRPSTPVIPALRASRARPKLMANITGEPKTVRRETRGAARASADLTAEGVARKIKQRLQQEGFDRITVRGGGIVITVRGKVRSRGDWQKVFTIAKEEVNAVKYTLDQQVAIVKSQ